MSRTAVLGFTALMITALPALADEPKNQSVTYNIRNDPHSESSSIIWTVTLDLSTDSVNGETVKWHVDAIHIRDEVANRRWSESNPTVDTGDGYWYVTHADHDEPQADEFDVVPAITGTANNVEPSGDDLNYDFLGEFLGGSPPWQSDFSAMTYSFTLVDESVPEAEGEEEPGDIDLPEDPP